MVYSNGEGGWGYGTGNPFIYDRFTESSAEQSLINSSLFPNPSASLGNQLTSNNVFFDGTNALAANNGSRPRLYSPSQWRPGSSYSHLDEDTYGPGTPNSLNTPFLDYAEAIHDPGPIALGILKDIGWSTAPTLPKIAIAKTTDGNETGPVASVFTLTRTGSTIAALNVSYTLAGAATLGLDYTGRSPGTATFAAGSATTTITLSTIDDILVDPNETIVATIAAPSGYTISGSASATVTIADNDGIGTDFSNSVSIAIPESGASIPYPSTINVSGLSANLANLKVTLTDLSHTYLDDIDILLVGPTGAKAILMSDVGGGSDVYNLTLAFDPSATAGLPDAGQITSGTYLPTDFEPGDDIFGSPAPAGPYGTAFSVFNNTNPNGTWSLYVLDDESGDLGTIAGGWTLSLNDKSIQSDFSLIKIIGNVAFGTSQLNYAIKLGDAAPIQVIFQGRTTSANYPGAGWSAIAAAASATGYDLFFKNTNGSYAAWNLDSNCVYTTGKLLSTIELLQAETNLNTDLDGDGTNGFSFAPTRTIGTVALGNWQQGYALKVGSGNPIPITYAGINASGTSPGAGWSAIAAAASATGYDLYFKNTNGSYAAWNLDSNGFYTAGKLLSTVEVVAEEVSIQADLTGEGQIGPFKLRGGGPLGACRT